MSGYPQEEGQGRRAGVERMGRCFDGVSIDCRYWLKGRVGRRGAVGLLDSVPRVQEVGIRCLELAELVEQYGGILLDGCGCLLFRLASRKHLDCSRLKLYADLPNGEDEKRPKNRRI